LWAELNKNRAKRQRSWNPLIFDSGAAYLHGKWRKNDQLTGSLIEK
jgi:hypothetical protein